MTALPPNASGPPDTATSQYRIVRDHFNEMALNGSYARFYKPIDTPLTHDFLARMARVKELLDAHITRDHRVLDLGCGTGPMIEYVCSKGARYHGLDVAPGMLSSISQTFSNTPYWPNIELRLGSCDTIPYPSAHFDSIVAMGLVEYLDDCRPALHEISRVTKPGGVAVLTVPNLHCVNRFIMRHASGITSLYHLWRRLRGHTATRGSGIIHREFAPAVLDRLMVVSGFQALGRAYYDYRLVCYPLTRTFPNLAFRINQHIENRGPHLLANGYIGLYKKVGGS